MKTFAQEFAGFMKAIGLADCSPVQRKEMEKAFMAGAHQALCNVTHASSAMKEEAAMFQLDTWHRELTAYSARGCQSPPKPNAS